MNLLIEHRQLLMPFVAPWSKKERAHRKPDGWTPNRTPEMHAAFDALKVEHDTTPDHILWSQVETDEAERMTGKPWPGWVGVIYAQNPEIGDAYKALYLRMNEKYAAILARGITPRGIEIEMPADGRYIFEGGIMERVE